MKNFIKKLFFIIPAMLIALLLTALQFTPPEIIYKLFIRPAQATNITDLEGITGKIGQEDINFGTGQDTDTFTVPTYDGGTVTLTKLPSLFANAASIIKGKWYVAAMSGDHGNASLTGSLAWVINTLGADPATIELPGNQTYSLTTNLVIPETIVLDFQRGAVLGGTANISGDGLKHIQAGAWQIFSTSGTITFPNGSEAYPQWFGAVGDGTTDDTTAFNKTIASCGYIKILPATYIVGPLTLSTADQKFIMSQGATLKAKTDIADAVITITASGVEVRGGNINGNRANQSSSTGCYGINVKTDGADVEDVKIADVYITTTAHDGIHLAGIEAGTYEINDASITDCYIEDMSGHGIEAIYHVNRAYIANNRIQNGATQVSVYVGNGIWIGDNSTNPQVVSNYIYNVKRMGIEIWDDSGGSMENAVVDGNHVVKCSTSAGYMNISISRVPYCSVTGNVVEEGRTGIEIVYSDYSDISGNTINNMTSAGISVGYNDHIAIGDTVIEDTDVYAITTYSADYVTISNVNMKTGADGIYVNTGTGITVTGCVIKDMTGAGFKKAGTFTDFTFTNNTVENTGAHAVQANNVVRGVFSGNRIYNRQATASLRGITICYADVRDVTISNNVIKGYDRGIQFGVSGQPGGKHFAITGNVISDIGTYGIEIYTGEFGTISGNMTISATSGVGRGIDLTSTSQYVSITGNNSYDLDYGIYVSSSCDYIITTDNMLQGNTTGVSNGATNKVNVDNL